MSKLFRDNEHVIRMYCDENHLDFEKAKKMPKSWNDKEGICYVQFYDEEDEPQYDGLKIDIPMPIVLMIHKVSGGIAFEQTEHTIKYLTYAS